MSKQTYIAPRTALFMPASNARAIEKARGLAVDMVILGPIASTSGWGFEIAGLIVGTNDLAAGLHLPPCNGRDAMATALQLIVLAARAREIWALDGVFNALDDPEGLEAECRAGRALGFDGKTLIHPGQLEIAARAFAATESEIAEARVLIAAAGGGAERHKDRMIEEMHVDQAKALLAREGMGTP